MNKSLRKTIFCDIDGTICKHQHNLYAMTQMFELLPGVAQKFEEWRTKDYHIIITTSRPESCREITQNQLVQAGIFYHQLIMGIPNGERFLINDKKLDGLITSYSLALDRDSGLENIEI